MYCGGSGGSSRSSAQSLPSAGSAGGLNPSNIAKVKGFGFETMFQAGNPPLFNIVTGTGRIGALVSPTQENTFWGNRPIEIDDVYFLRREGKKQYKNKKLSLAVGASLIDNKHASFDLGVSVKRNPDLKKFNPGFAASGKLFIFTFGFYYSKDDVKVDLGNYLNLTTLIPYQTTYGSKTYIEKFSMMTYTVGLQLGNLSADAGFIKTKYKFYSEDTTIRLVSLSYSFKKLLFNIAQREENSPNFMYANGMLVNQRKKQEIYYGLQYLYNKHFLLGVAYNHFLLHEGSASLTIFL
jgi:hypothetical protein